MPNPLSKTRGAGGTLTFGTQTFSERPEHAFLVAEIITFWSQIEANLGMTLAWLLASNVATTMQMYGALNGFTNQRMALEAAARAALDSRDFELFEDTLTVVGRRATQRHRFAHWLWGLCDLLQNDELLLVEPKHVWHFVGKASDAMRDNQKIGGLTDVSKPLPKIDESKILVWNRKELIDVKESMGNALAMTAKLTAYIMLPKDPFRDSIRSELYSLPEMATLLQKRLGQSSLGKEMSLLPELCDTTDVY